MISSQGRGPFPQNPVHGLAQRPEYQRCPIHVVARRVRCRYQQPGRARRLGGCHIGEDVPHHRALVGFDRQGFGRGENHPGVGLATRTPRFGGVRADLPGIERTEKFRHSGVHLRQLLRVEIAETKPGLVADHTNLEADGPQPVECPFRPRHRGYQGGIRVVGNIGNQRSVPIDQDRGETAGMPFGDPAGRATGTPHWMSTGHTSPPIPNTWFSPFRLVRPQSGELLPRRNELNGNQGIFLGTATEQATEVGQPTRF